MEIIEFENGVKIQEAYVEINGIKYYVTPAVWSGNTPASAYNINRMQNNIKAEIEKNSIYQMLKIEGNNDQDGIPSINNPIKIDIVGQDNNILTNNPIDWESGTILYGVLQESTNRIRNKNYEEIESNTDYAIRVSNTNYKIGNITYYNQNKEYLNTLYDLTGKTMFTETIFKTPENAKYYKIVLAKGDIPINPEEIEEIKIKLEKGTTYSDFGQGKINFRLSDNNVQSKDIVIPMQEPILDGDYLDLDKEEEVHTIGKLTLEGTEDWELVSPGTENYYYQLEFTKAKQSEVLCTHFSYAEISSDNTNEGIWINSEVIRIRYDSEQTLEEFKAKLAELYETGKPIIIYYKLAKEVRLPFTTEQKEAIRSLKNAYYIDGLTNITCLDELEPIIEIEEKNKETVLREKEQQTEQLRDEIESLKAIIETLQSAS